MVLDNEAEDDGEEYLMDELGNIYDMQFRLIGKADDDEEEDDMFKRKMPLGKEGEEEDDYENDGFDL